MEFSELNYVSFEHIFVKCCNGCVVTGLDRPKVTKTDAQYVDWFILLPAIMDENERMEYLGADYQKITKDTLNAMRKGRVRREYIDALFWKDDAVEIVFQHFLEKVPQAIVGANRKRIVEELWSVIQKDIIIPEKRRLDFEYRKDVALSEIETMKRLPDDSPVMPEWFCEFLAAAFVFAMNREKLLSDELQLSPSVVQVIKDLEEGKTVFLNALLDSMADAITDGEPDENNNRVMKAVNDSDYSEDDFRYFALKLIGLHPKLDEDHSSKFFAIRTFAMNLDESRLVSEAGLDAVDALYEKYNIARNERTSMMIDPNVNDASYSFTFGDGKRMKVELHGNPDGTTRVNVIGKEDS
ncbi:MAG: hypothetical protein Q4G00_14225 [Clostridia bacterium]|nr:hypothetical protein [Clostridia bacterium]